MNLFIFCLIFVRLSLAQDEEFAIEPNENDDKDFETKAHLDPGTFYYILNGKNTVQGNAYTPTSQAGNVASSRPVWRPVFSNSFYSKPVVQPRKQQQQQPVQNTAWATPRPHSSIPYLTPKDIPEQLRILG